MSPAVDRRRFMELSALSGLALGTAATLHGEEKKEEPKSVAKSSANDKIVIGLMGVNGRGSALAKGFVTQPGCEIAYVCDVDERAVAKATALVTATQSRKPDGVSDFRKILDDKTVDVLVCAAPNHWHAPATILGCAAGKHVYVEKPCSHTAREGELAVEAARKHKRVVQMGSQRRSFPALREAKEKIDAGVIGRVMYARTWYNNKRPSIGKGTADPVPSWLDYTLWQGPVTERPFKSNLVHYNWHWHWHWGNGELGNNGVHALDVARWLMGVEYPSRVTSAGSKYRHDDDQETPDTHVVTYEFGNKSITWEGLSWSPMGPGATKFGIAVMGDNGSLLITDSGYTIFDLMNKEVVVQKGDGSDASHLANFLDCVRTGKRPNADIEEAHKSTLLCHLGNISHRVGRVLHTDPQNGHILKDDEADALWSKEYRKGWEPKV